MGFRRVEILISGSNKKSLGVVERLGIPLEGVLKMERVNPDGTVDDTHIYAWIAEQDSPSEVLTRPTGLRRWPT